MFASFFTDSRMLCTGVAHCYSRWEKNKLKVLENMLLRRITGYEQKESKAIPVTDRGGR
jgi:hypothetical protein